MTKVLRVPAIEIQQGPGRLLYSFAVDGKRIPEFAAISRLGRTGEASIVGYQRPEVQSHIAEIRRYLESENPMIPNAIVVAFDERVVFVPIPDYGEESGSGGRIGLLSIPIDSEASEPEKVGWVVDGQQRIAAIRDASIASFPVSVVGFIAPDAAEQRAQFILVNSTKPLPKGLIYELLPTTDTKLPGHLERRKFPAMLLERLNLDADSPLKTMVRTPTNGEGVIQDNSVLRMIENSLSDGALFRYRASNAVPPDVGAMLGLLKTFWRATARVFPDAWGLPPKRSRLMHGAGIVSMGFLMDAVADRYRAEAPNEEVFATDLEGVRPACRWTNGYWDFGPGVQRKWNEIQNTTTDVQLLTNYLLVQYRSRVWSKSTI